MNANRQYTNELKIQTVAPNGPNVYDCFVYGLFRIIFFFFPF